MQIAAMPRLPPVRSQDVQHVQHDARARRADRMPDRDRAAVDVELVLVERAHRAGQAELVAAVASSSHARRHADHLRGERLVDLPRVEVVRARGRAAAASASPRARGRGPSAPDRARPIASRRCGRAASSLCSSTARSDASDHPRAAVGHLRAVAGGDVAVLAVEERLELREVLDGRILAHAVVGRVERAALVVDRHRPRRRSAPPAARRARARGCARRTRPSPARVMPKRYARFSAVWPISRPTIGSVSPFMSAITGAK